MTTTHITDINTPNLIITLDDNLAESFGRVYTVKDDYNDDISFNNVPSKVSNISGYIKMFLYLTFSITFSCKRECVI